MTLSVRASMLGNKFSPPRCSLLHVLMQANITACFPYMALAPSAWLALDCCKAVVIREGVLPTP